MPSWGLIRFLRLKKKIRVRHVWAVAPSRVPKSQNAPSAMEKAKFVKRWGCCLVVLLVSCSVPIAKEPAKHPRNHVAIAKAKAVLEGEIGSNLIFQQALRKVHHLCSKAKAK